MTEGAAQQAVTSTSLPLSLVAKGKVRDVYDAGILEGEHRGALLFVATDRISAFDIILENVSSYSRSVMPDSYLRLPALTGHTKQREAVTCTIDILVPTLDTFHNRVSYHSD